jgi:rhomboid protease GluP
MKADRSHLQQIVSTTDPIAEATQMALFPRMTPAPLSGFQEPAKEPETDPFGGLTAIGPVPSERKARDYALVLQSMSIWHVLRRPYPSWVVLVRDEDYARAADAIDRYEAENRDWPPHPARERSRYPTSAVVPALFAALVLFYFVTGPANDHVRWFQRGEAVTRLVLSAEPWRAVTALTLHADSAHVLGNAVSGTIFASAVQRRLGSGGSAIAVLASGILGNVANAFWHHSSGDVGHRSIGASTAVFGAVGILAATQMAIDHAPRAERRPWTDLAGPLVGGLALLGALGAGGENTDLGAHLFGFLGGLVVGLFAAFPLRRGVISMDLRGAVASRAVSLGRGEPRAWVQATLGAVTLAVILGAWRLAMHR